MTRTKILAGNWKMNFSPSEALTYFSQLNTELMKKGTINPKAETKRVICPPAYCFNDRVMNAADSCGVELGAQSVHSEEKGAFTGELSSTVLKTMGVNWTLIAHSERRQFFGETDASAAKRLKRAIASGMNVIYCIGETLDERESGKMEAILTKQTEAYLSTMKESKLAAKQIVCIAYEPVWAIGTGKTATPEQAEEAHVFIRSKLTDKNTSILYGGSVTAENCGQILSKSNVDGVLVGGASLKPDQFSVILSG